MCHGFAPSTRAASASSVGIARKNWRSRNVPNAPPRNAPTQSGSCVPIQLPLAEAGCGSRRNSTKFGTRTTWNGMMSVTSRRAKSGSRKRKRSVAKAKAAMEQLMSCPIVLSDASLTELMKNWPNGSRPHISG